MRSRLLPVALISALALGAGACDLQALPVAARVDGATISPATLHAVLDTTAKSPGFRCEIEQAAQGAQPIEGTGTSTYAASFVAYTLTNLVQIAAVHAAVAGLAVQTAPSVVDGLAATQLASAFAPQQGTSCTVPGAQVFASLSPTYRELLREFQVDQDVLAAHLAGVDLTPAGLASYQATHRATTTLACVAAIEVATKAKASALAAQIARGGDFATLAKANSLDTASAANGGSLGCLFASQFSSPLDTLVSNLPVGQLSPPTAFGSSYVLMLVKSRPNAPTAEVARVIVDGVAAKVAARVSAITAAARVRVDPAYGDWVHTGSTVAVRPLTGPASALLPNAAAVTPQGAGLSG